MPDQPAPQLQRILGLTEVTAGGVGIIIGAGIYVLVGSAAAEAGAAVWLAFVLSAGLSFLTAMSYMELASMYPSAAGEFEYTRQAFPGWLAFLVGWIMIAALVVAAAAISLGFARYLSNFVDLDLRIGAIFLLLLVSAIAITGIKQSARLTVTLSVIQVAGLVLVVVIGAPHIGQENILKDSSAGGVLSAAALVFFAFIGFDEVITLSEETRNPTRTVPLALALALGLSTLLYILVAIAAVSVLGAEALGKSTTPLADVLSHGIGAGGGDLMSALAVICTTNTTLLALTAGSRLVFGMADRDSLPHVFARLHSTRQTPVAAVLICAALAAGFVMMRDLELIASVTDFAVYLVFLAVNATVVALRFKKPDVDRPFAVPGSVGRVPIIPILGNIAVVVMIMQLELGSVALGILLLGAGLIFFFVLQKFAGLAKPS